MTILFIGDIVGSPGRQAVKELLPGLKQEYAVDLVVANGENARHGNGLDIAAYDELRAAGVDWFTGGDHTLSQRDFLPLLESPLTQALRPANYPAGVPGRGMAVFRVGNDDVTLISLQGRVFMKPLVDNPFTVVDTLLQDARGFVFIDFHAEATSEKNTLGHYLDGRVGAMVGTHTHVQTADERLLPKGTAYITDAGMTGPADGSVGASYKNALKSYTHGLTFKNEPAEGPVQFNAVLVRTADGKATGIERVFRRLA